VKQPTAFLATAAFWLVPIVATAEPDCPACRGAVVKTCEAIDCQKGHNRKTPTGLCYDCLGFGLAGCRSCDTGRAWCHRADRNRARFRELLDEVRKIAVTLNRIRLDESAGGDSAAADRATDQVDTLKEWLIALIARQRELLQEVLSRDQHELPLDVDIELREDLPGDQHELLDSRQQTINLQLTQYIDRLLAEKKRPRAQPKRKPSKEGSETKRQPSRGTASGSSSGSGGNPFAGFGRPFGGFGNPGFNPFGFNPYAQFGFPGGGGGSAGPGTGLPGNASDGGTSPGSGDKPSTPTGTGDGATDNPDGNSDGNSDGDKDGRRQGDDRDDDEGDDLSNRVDDRKDDKRGNDRDRGGNRGVESRPGAPKPNF